jgi:hypothetical protein
MQNRSYFRSQSKFNKYKKFGISPCILSDHIGIKLKFNNKSNRRKYSNTWRLNNMLLNDQWVIEEIREEMKKFLEFNENQSITYQNLWNTTKAVLRRKFIAMNPYIKNTERSQINNLVLHFKLLEKQEQKERDNKNKGQNQ